MAVLGVVDVAPPPPFTFRVCQLVILSRNECCHEGVSCFGVALAQVLQVTTCKFGLAGKYLLKSYSLVIGALLGLYCHLCGDFGCVGFTLLHRASCVLHRALYDGCGCVGVTLLHHASYV